MSKSIKITLSDKALFTLDWLVNDENTRTRSVEVERLIMQSFKKRKQGDRPEYNPEEGEESNV